MRPSPLTLCTHLQPTVRTKKERNDGGFEEDSPSSLSATLRLALGEEGGARSTAMAVHCRGSHRAWISVFRTSLSPVGDAPQASSTAEDEVEAH